MLKIILLAIAIALGLLLFYISFQPLLRGRRQYQLRLPHGQAIALGDFSEPAYKRIAITVDFSAMDAKTIEHAVSQGGKNAEYIFIHIVETAGALLSEKEVGDMEAGEDIAFLKAYVDMLKARSYMASYHIGFGRRARTIAAIVDSVDADLLVMGAHGHQALKDAIFGETINSVRHKIKVPLLAVK